ncbi:MAG: Rid family detoxifying hydrolase [Acidobacteriota bacterium]
MGKRRIATKKAPEAIGPYSQAVAAGGLIFLSGQIPIDPARGVLVEGGIEAQTDRVMRNLAAVLEAAGAALSDVVKTTVYLADLQDFEAMNRTYAGFFDQEPPARATVEVSRLPKGTRLEIEAVAVQRGG